MEAPVQHRVQTVPHVAKNNSDDWPAVDPYIRELKRRGYVISGSLGEGSYAKVKKANSTKDQCQVAIKIIDRSKAPGDFLRRFMPRELDILGRIRHPNCVQLYDLFHIKSRTYVVLELAGHGDLLDYIRLRGALSEKPAKFMFRQLYEAIGYLHCQHIIHRDLKCENILLDLYNNIKLSDFGFARSMDPTTDVSRTYCGSAAYAAPEILQGIPYKGFGYDIWSLGVILFIMVCGSMPFDDANVKKMIKDQLNKKIHFPSKVRSKLPAVAQNLILGMLEPDLKKRLSMNQISHCEWMKACNYQYQISNECVTRSVESALRHLSQARILKMSKQQRISDAIMVRPKTPRPCIATVENNRKTRSSMKDHQGMQGVYRRTVSPLPKHTAGGNVDEMYLPTYEVSPMEVPIQPCRAQSDVSVVEQLDDAGPRTGSYQAKQYGRQVQVSSSQFSIATERNAAKRNSDTLVS